ncbi:hypothetical protein B0T09DRAFT_366004 [Sordaria sp. MPI-SDFR-AT-0083]|nr:hypothetical protein B0T09DRAFT_366004 [Sordaria sp. MPI-SDFR-AT-0083]
MVNKGLIIGPLSWSALVDSPVGDMPTAHSISARSMPSMSTQQYGIDQTPRPPSASLGRKSSIRAVPYDPIDTRLPIAPSLSGASIGSYSPSGWPFPKGHQRQNSKSKLPIPVDSGSPTRMARRETSPTRKFAQRSVMRAAASAPSRQGSFHESSLRNETYNNSESSPDKERDSDEIDNGTIRASQTMGAKMDESEERPKSRHGRAESLTRASASSLASRPKTPFPFSGPGDSPPERPTNPTPHAGLTKQSERLEDPRFTAEYFETISIRDHAPSPEPLTPPHRLSVAQSDSTDAMYGGSRQVSTFSTVHEVDEEGGDHDTGTRDTLDLERTMTFMQDTSEDQTFADKNISLESSVQQDESTLSSRRASNPFGFHKNVDIGDGTPDRGIMLIDPNLTADLTSHNISRVTSGSRMWTPLPNIDSIRRGPKIRHDRVIPEPGGGSGGIAPARSGLIPPVNTLADLAILGGNGSGNKLNDLEDQDPEQQETARKAMRLQKWLVPVSFGVLQVSIISFVASIAVYASRASQSPISAGIIAWISISTVLLVSSLATLLIGVCAVASLRKQETGEDPWIEMHRLARALPPRPPAEKEGNDKADKKSKALAEEDKAATEEAWKKFADDQEQLRKYVEKLEQEILNIKEKRKEEHGVMHAAQKQQQKPELHPIGTAISTGDQTPDSKANSHSHKQPTFEDCPSHCNGSSEGADEDITLTPKASKATQTTTKPSDSRIADNKPTYYHTSGGHRRRPRSNTTHTTGHQSLHRLLGPPSELDSGHFQRTGLGVPASNSGGTIASLNLHIYHSPGQNLVDYNHHGYNHNNHGPDSQAQNDNHPPTTYKHAHNNAHGDRVLPPTQSPAHTAIFTRTPSGVVEFRGVPISQTQSSILTELCEAVTLSSLSRTGSSTFGGIESYSPLGRDEISGAMRKAGVNNHTNNINKGVTPSPSPRPSQSMMNQPETFPVSVGTSSSSASASNNSGAAASGRAESNKTGNSTRTGYSGMPKGMMGGVRAVTASDVAPEDDEHLNHHHSEHKHEHEPMPQMPQMPDMAKLKQQQQQRKYLSPEPQPTLSQKDKMAYYGTFRRQPSQRGDVRGVEFFAGPTNDGEGR